MSAPEAVATPVVAVEEVKPAETAPAPEPPAPAVDAPKPEEVVQPSVRLLHLSTSFSP